MHSNWGQHVCLASSYDCSFQLNGNARQAQETIFNSVNSMKVGDKSYYPTKVISSRDGPPIFNGKDRKARRKEYFQKLYSLNVMVDNS